MTDDARPLRTLADEWLERANEDLRVAERLADEDEFAGTVCLHAQQCVEKCLKAFLTVRGVQAHRTHDLVVLGDQCAELEVAFEEWLPTVAGLSDYAVETRYPGGAYPTVHDAEEAAVVARTVFDFVHGRVTE